MNIRNKIVIALLCAAALAGTSCSGMFGGESAAESDGYTTVTVGAGTVNSAERAAYPSGSLTGIDSMEMLITNEAGNAVTDSCKVSTAFSFNSQTAAVTNGVYKLKAGTYTFTVNAYKSVQTNDSNSKVLIYTGSVTKTYPSGNSDGSNFSIYLTAVSGSTVTGSVKLYVLLPAASSSPTTMESSIAGIAAIDEAAAKTQSCGYVTNTVSGSAAVTLSEALYKENQSGISWYDSTKGKLLELTASGVTPGVYSLELTLATLDGIFGYYCDKFTVLPGLTTDTWYTTGSGSTASSQYITLSDATVFPASFSTTDRSVVFVASSGTDATRTLPAGSTSGNGTIALPYNHLSDALSSVSTGGTIYVDGTITDVNIDASPLVEYDFVGTTDKTVTIKSFNDAVPAVFNAKKLNTGTEHGSMYPVLYINAGDASAALILTFENMTFTGGAYNSSANNLYAGTAGIAIYGNDKSLAVTLSKCTVTGNDGSALYANGSNVTLTVKDCAIDGTTYTINGENVPSGGKLSCLGVHFSGTNSFGNGTAEITFNRQQVTDFTDSVYFDDSCVINGKLGIDLCSFSAVQPTADTVENSPIIIGSGYSAGNAFTVYLNSAWNKGTVLVKPDVNNTLSADVFKNITVNNSVLTKQTVSLSLDSATESESKGYGIISSTDEIAPTVVVNKTDGSYISRNSETDSLYYTGQTGYLALTNSDDDSGIQSVTVQCMQNDNFTTEQDLSKLDFTNATDCTEYNSTDLVAWKTYFNKNYGIQLEFTNKTHYAMKISVIDNVGNEYLKYYDLYIDTSNADFSFDSSGILYANGALNITGTASDAESGLKNTATIKINSDNDSDGTFETTVQTDTVNLVSTGSLSDRSNVMSTATWSYTVFSGWKADGTKDGKYEIEGSAYNYADGGPDSSIKYIYYDTVAPVISTSSLASGTLSVTATDVTSGVASVTAVAADDTTATKVTLAQDTTQSGTSTWTATSCTAASYTVTVTDNAGNTTTATVPVTQ